ncbi:MAG: hypothetical protein AABN33_10935 [Acidobacteriota bacterium]
MTNTKELKRLTSEELLQLAAALRELAKAERLEAAQGKGGK